MLSPSSSTASMSLALMKPSERHVRVLATMMAPLEVSWVQMASGQERSLYVNLLYALCGEAGELHLPKHDSRQELALTQAQ
eukprot:3402904-Pleurochrysis_carterae.AAC.1